MFSPAVLLEVFSECLEALISHVLISEEVYAGKSAQVKTSRKAEQYPGGSVSGSCTGRMRLTRQPGSL